MKEIIVIVGPTGVGKTKLSIELAKKINGEIINADSVSIYKHLNIGSAKPTEQEQKEAKHHLIDIKELDQIDARKKIDEISSKEKRVIIVGGTGLYIKAALYDYRFTKGTTYNTYDSLTNEEIIEKITSKNMQLDIHPNNRKRLVRTLNKLENNEDITNYKNKPLYKLKIIGLTTARDNLYKRINNRVEKMIDNGLLDEVNNLKDKYTNSNILNNAIGYKEFRDYLFKNKPLSDVIEDIKKNCRHYAKRQYTFFNNQMEVKWFNVDYNDFNNTINEVEEYLKLTNI